MLIKILEDTHDICSRLKEIDCNYFVVYNSNRECFEVHNSSQKNSYCLTVPFKSLDCRTISLTLKTRREFLEKILNEIDQNNEKLERENKQNLMDKTKWKLKEIYSYAKSHDQEIKDAYVTKWA